MRRSRLDPRHTADASKNARNATNAAPGPHGNKRSSTRGAAAGEDGKMDLHVFLYDGIVRDWVEIKFQAPTPSTRRWGSRKSTQVRDKDPADRDAASDVGCYFTVGDQTFTSDILLNTNEPNFRYLPRPEPRPPSTRLAQAPSSSSTARRRTRRTPSSATTRTWHSRSSARTSWCSARRATIRAVRWL